MILISLILSDYDHPSLLSQPASQLETIIFATIAGIDNDSDQSFTSQVDWEEMSEVALSKHDSQVPAHHNQAQSIEDRGRAIASLPGQQQIIAMTPADGEITQPASVVPTSQTPAPSTPADVTTAVNVAPAQTSQVSLD